jgi:hypothetical protein
LKYCAEPLVPPITEQQINLISNRLRTDSESPWQSVGAGGKVPGCSFLNSLISDTLGKVWATRGSTHKEPEGQSENNNVSPFSEFREEVVKFEAVLETCDGRNKLA